MCIQLVPQRLGTSGFLPDIKDDEVHLDGRRAEGVGIPPEGERVVGSSVPDTGRRGVLVSCHDVTAIITTWIEKVSFKWATCQDSTLLQGM